MDTEDRIECDGCGIKIPNPGEDCDDEALYCDKCNEPKTFEVRVQIPVTVSFTVEARDADEARDIAGDEARDMRLTTYIHSGTAEMLGVTDRNGVPAKDARFDYPENLVDGDFEIEEAS